MNDPRPRWLKTSVLSGPGVGGRTCCRRGRSALLPTTRRAVETGTLRVVVASSYPNRAGPQRGNRTVRTTPVDYRLGLVAGTSPRALSPSRGPGGSSTPVETEEEAV